MNDDLARLLAKFVTAAREVHALGHRKGCVSLLGEDASHLCRCGYVRTREALIEYEAFGGGTHNGRNIVDDPNS